jgi:hypothetical protein
VHREDMKQIRKDLRTQLSAEGKAEVGFNGTPTEWRNVRATAALWAKKNGKKPHTKFTQHNGWQEFVAETTKG